MYDAGKIIFGLFVFAILFTSPFWLNLSGNPEYSPDVKYPTGESECIATKEYMNHNHMEILNDWRNKVVRSDLRYYKKNGRNFMIDGQPAEMSLTHSCLKCHNDKKVFCDRCHDYLAVKPYCWDCHVVPGEVKK